MFWSLRDFLAAQVEGRVLVSKPFGEFKPGEHEYCVLLNGTSVILRPDEWASHRRNIDVADD